MDKENRDNSRKRNTRNQNGTSTRGRGTSRGGNMNNRNNPRNESESSPRGTSRGGNMNNRGRGFRGNSDARQTPRTGRGGGRFPYNQRDGNKNRNDKAANYGISYQKIEELCNGMDQRKILPGSPELLVAVQADSFYKRLDDLWPDAEKQSNFLRVIVATASTSQSDHLRLTYAFVTKVFESSFLEKIIGKYICPLMYDKRMQEEPVYAEIAHYTVKLLLNGFALLPSQMDPHLPKVQNVITSLKEVKEICLKEETKVQLERLEIALKDRHEAKATHLLATEFVQKENKDFEGSVGEPPSNFRELSVVPVPEDIIHQYAPYLRPAKVKGRYESDEQYLDIQFRLLREDLVRPLRDGITAYRKGGTRESDLYIYNEVELGASTMHKPTGELISFAHIKFSRRMRWDKRLKYGALVCLSSDDFHNVFLFATVIERDLLPKGKIGLKFEEVSKINTQWKYKMVESPAFFEAYRHVMVALKAIEQDQPIPFSKYLVNVETNTEAPGYSRDQQFNFESLLKANQQETKFFLHEIQHLKPDDFGMDESQYNALVYALTSELAILQGPPGTGKTYMGLRIAKLLFDNWKIWNPFTYDSRPMLVVCYTNHALDQFLEGISKFVPDGIIRVGGRCKNENIEKFNLSKMRRWDNLGLRNRFLSIKSKVNDLQCELKKASINMKAYENRFASPYQLKTIIEDSDQRYYNTSKELTKMFDDDGATESLMFRWLTQTNQAFQINEYDIDIIRQLVAMNIPEIKAKNVLAFFNQMNDYPEALDVYYYLQSRQGRNFSSTKLSTQAQNWPKLADIDNIKRLGFTDKIAAELLVRSNVQKVRNEYNRIKGMKTNRKLATLVIPEPVENEPNEDVDDLIFQDDDQENRMIFDTNILDEIEVSKIKFKYVREARWFNREVLQDFFDHITSAYPMTEEEANRVVDIWTLTLPQRWRLYQYWIKKCREVVKDEIKEKETAYGEKVKQMLEYRSLGDLDVLKSAKVVGMTTTGAAKHQSTLRALRSKIVIVEEAAEVLEAHLITSLTQGCEHLILIGDHKQLRPSPAVYQLAKKYNLEISLFERLINNGYPYRMLKNQHRMCTDISRVLMPHFYEDLQDDPSVFERESVKGVTKNLVFVNHSYPEVTEREFKSHKNIYEAEFALRLAKYFLQQSYKAEQITILCTYLDQLIQLRKMAFQMFGQDHGFVIQSVDNYQGEENDIVILSLVRSNNPENKIGFLKIPNRVCVALSRAKHGLYVICNMDFLAKECDMWNKIRDSVVEAGALSNEFVVRCQMHQNEQVIQSFEDFDSKCREGGCDIPCNTRLECGHQCTKPCHAEDINHVLQKCLKPCARKCDSGYQHPCKKDCWKPCGNCYIKVLKDLPCNHQKIDYCFIEPTDVRCVEKCKKTLSCGHPCKETCGAECTKSCNKTVKRQLPECGHFVSMCCSQKLDSVKCNAIVTKKWPLCNHAVETKCSTNVADLKCPHPCDTVLPGCDHICKGSCGKCRNGRLHIPCSENCKKVFLCEHECEAKCSKICQPCSKPCETACGHSQCGSQPINGEQKKKTRKLFNQKTGQNGGRKCGEPCPPCMEKCLNRCEHRQCSNKCGDPCDVMPCSKPCMKLLPCNPKRHGKNGEPEEPSEHRCIGVCGEECLKICEICNPEEFAKIKEVFFGTEEKEDARFVQLKDCGHIFEVEGLDKWIEASLPKKGDEESSIEIVQIKCPQCKTSIRRSKRYISILNERAIDIEQIKQKNRGLTNAEKKKEQVAFKQEVKEVFAAFKATDFGSSKEVASLEEKLIKADQNVLTKDYFLTWKNVLRIIQALTSYEKLAKEKIDALNKNLTAKTYKMFKILQVADIKEMPNFKAKLSELKIINFWVFLEEESNRIIKVISSSSVISELMIQQISFEVRRIGFLIDLWSYFSKAVRRNIDFTPAEIEMISDIFVNLNGNKEFKDAFEKEMAQKLENLAKMHPVSNFGISDRERIEIVKAAGLDIRHWYKCPNGHHYGIGDCGGAVMTAKCPECKENIGGGSHQILPTNQDAQAEMLEGSEIAPNPYVNPFVARW